MNDRATGIGEALAGLRDALAPVLDAGAARTASDDELLTWAADAEALGRFVDAARLEIAGEIGHRSRPELGGDRLSATRGCRTPGELLERVTLVAGVTARARLKAATPLRARTTLAGAERPALFDHCRQALLSGLIGPDAAMAVTGALTPILERGVDPADLDAAERALVGAAVGSDDELPASADEVAIMAGVWALHLDPDGALPDQEAALRKRGLSLGRERDGTVPLRGDLLPDVAAQLQRIIDAYTNPRVTAGPTFVPDDVDLADGDPLLDPRSQPQRRHDAFAGILRVAAGLKDTPLLGGAAPTLVITTTTEELGRSNGVASLSGARDLGAVPVSVAHHVGCAGAIQRLRLTPDGRIIELGSPQRLFGAHTRRAIAIRDGECVIPRCHVPAMWCEVHHVTPASEGGPTHTDNGVLLCWHHHATIDTAGWEIRMIHGVPWIKAPQWLDPAQRWRPSPGSPQRQLTALSSAPPGDEERARQTG